MERPRALDPEEVHELTLVSSRPPPGPRETAVLQRRVRRLAPAPTATIARPKAAHTEPLPEPTGDVEHVLLVVTAASALQSPPSHDDEALALICTLRTPFRAAMHWLTSEAPT
jgi:hypothetical protein